MREKKNSWYYFKKDPARFSFSRVVFPRCVCREGWGVFPTFSLSLSRSRGFYFVLFLHSVCVCVHGIVVCRCSLRVLLHHIFLYFSRSLADSFSSRLLPDLYTGCCTMYFNKKCLASSPLSNHPRFKIHSEAPCIIYMYIYAHTEPQMLENHSVCASAHCSGCTTTCTTIK